MAGGERDIHHYLKACYFTIWTRKFNKVQESINNFRELCKTRKNESIHTGNQFISINPSNNDVE